MLGDGPFHLAFFSLRPEKTVGTADCFRRSRMRAERRLR